MIVKVYQGTRPSGRLSKSESDSHNFANVCVERFRLPGRSIKRISPNDFTYGVAMFHTLRMRRPRRLTGDRWQNRTMPKVITTWALSACRGMTFSQARQYLEQALKLRPITENNLG